MSQDHAARAVIGVQHMGGGDREPLLELDDMFHICTPKGVDHLVVVANRKDVVLGQSNALQQEQLGLVQILELVYQQELEPRLVGAAQGAVLQQQTDCHVDHIVEVQEVITQL